MSEWLGGKEKEGIEGKRNKEGRGGGGDRKNKGDRQRERKRSPTDLIVKFLSFL